MCKVSIIYSIASGLNAINIIKQSALLNTFVSLMCLLFIRRGSKQCHYHVALHQLALLIITNRSQIEMCG